jgi:hypothetical protein
VSSISPRRLILRLEVVSGFLVRRSRYGGEGGSRTRLLIALGYRHVPTPLDCWMHSWRFARSTSFHSSPMISVLRAVTIIAGHLGLHRALGPSWQAVRFGLRRRNIGLQPPAADEMLGVPAAEPGHERTNKERISGKRAIS